MSTPESTSSSVKSKAKRDLIVIILTTFVIVVSYFYYRHTHFCAGQEGLVTTAAQSVALEDGVVVTTPVIILTRVVDNKPFQLDPARQTSETLTALMADQPLESDPQNKNLLVKRKVRVIGLGRGRVDVMPPKKDLTVTPPPQKMFGQPEVSDEKTMADSEIMVGRKEDGNIEPALPPSIGDAPMGVSQSTPVPKKRAVK